MTDTSREALAELRDLVGSLMPCEARRAWHRRILELEAQVLVDEQRATRTHRSPQEPLRRQGDPTPGPARSRRHGAPPNRPHARMERWPIRRPPVASGADYPCRGRSELREREGQVMRDIAAERAAYRATIERMRHGGRPSPPGPRADDPGFALYDLGRDPLFGRVERASRLEADIEPPTPWQS